ncbi:hypothetical protein NLI96_g5325 [Meripilus lineatus]|uniref:Uncharacterized protein n=1 Tax=Meripilus lineatus TaxID=2056292 RepID=A0AAD5V325_9APHY|nr:hypothetical protein NLI96_g5325 [Physisporinus lineatus]
MGPGKLLHTEREKVTTLLLTPQVDIMASLSKMPLALQSVGRHVRTCLSKLRMLPRTLERSKTMGTGAILQHEESKASS